MPRGFAGVRQAAKEQREKSGSGGAFFKLPNDGDTAIVRFLEQGDDIAWCWVHEVPVDGRKWPDLVPCLDQDKDGVDCPGCDADLKRKIQGYINVIWHDAPELRRDKEGKLVKIDGEVVPTGNTKPQVALWTVGRVLLEELDEINENFKGLRSRKFKVKRKGVKLDTTYKISPADIDSGVEPFSDLEEELEAKKTDVAIKIAPPTYEDFQKKMRGERTGGSSNSGGSGSDAAASAARKNPFMKKKTG